MLIDNIIKKSKYRNILLIIIFIVICYICYKNFNKIVSIIYNKNYNENFQITQSADTTTTSADTTTTTSADTTTTSADTTTTTSADTTTTSADTTTTSADTTTTIPQAYNQNSLKDDSIYESISFYAENNKPEVPTTTDNPLPNNTQTYYNNLGTEITKSTTELYIRGIN